MIGQLHTYLFKPSIHVDGHISLIITAVGRVTLYGQIISLGVVNLMTDGRGNPIHLRYIVCMHWSRFSYGYGESGWLEANVNDSISKLTPYEA